MLIVDDTPRKSKYNYGNAIYPKEFTEASNDTEWVDLMEYLIKIKDEPNFRNFEKRNWKELVKNRR